MRQLKITKQVTNRESRSLDKYLHEIAKEGMITPEEEVELSKRVKDGDGVALNKLVKANLRFVVSVAKQYQNQGLSLPDLINEGNVGLIKAAERFDATKGFKFISYAVWWIRQSILSALAEHARLVRLPLNKIASLMKINRVYVQMEQDLQRTPTVEEIAKELKMKPSIVKNMLDNSNRPVSMDAPFQDGEEGNMYDVISSKDSIAPDSFLSKESLQIEISRLLSVVTYRERDILEMYFGLNGSSQHTLEEIGQKLELTRERVRQIKEKALRKLKHGNNKKILRSFL
jgi:RNA polymerase primary sigma factor